MFSREKTATADKPARARASAPGLTFIGDEAVISGDISTGDQLHVDGRIEGNVRCGQLCQGSKGAIAGDIVAEEARVSGLIDGNLSARMVTIEASARVKGDIAYETVSIAAGADIQGRLARRDAVAKSETAAPMLVASTAAGAGERKALTLGEPGERLPLAETARFAAG